MPSVDHLQASNLSLQAFANSHSKISILALLAPLKA